MKSQKPCILLYNPISGHGHLDSWLELFIQILLKQEFCVLVITPDSKSLDYRLNQSGLDKHPFLQILSWKKILSQQSYIRKAWDFWVYFGERYYYGREGSQIVDGMSFGIQTKKKIYQMLVPSLFSISKYLRNCYRKIHPKSEDIEETGLDPMEFAIRVEYGIKKAKWKPDFLLNMYMDMYMTRIDSWNRFFSKCALPWGGIRFVPMPEPIEGFYSLSSLRGMCFLDEKISHVYSQKIPDKVFPFLPDITNTILPKSEPKLVEEMRHKANGRKIIFLGGSIGGQKNISRWCEVILLADPQKWFFLLIGEIHSNTFTKEDTEAFDFILKNQPENVFIFSEYIPDESLFNAFITASDMIFAVYRDFQLSSNMLGKAAFLEKPILVSEKYLMGERVRKYGIGIGVNENDSRAILDGLNQLDLIPISKQCFDDYRSVFNIHNLWVNLSPLLNFLKKEIK